MFDYESYPMGRDYARAIQESIETELARISRSSQEGEYSGGGCTAEDHDTSPEAIAKRERNMELKRRINEQEREEQLKLEQALLEKESKEFEEATDDLDEAFDDYQNNLEKLKKG
jgi:hypothetical protein